MPLTLTLTEGVVPRGKEQVVFSRLSEAMLRWHGMSGNTLMTENIVGTIHVLPISATLTGMKETAVAFAEWKVPPFAFTDRKVQIGYFAEATEIIHELSGGKLPRNHIFVNVVHAVDGAWNFKGKALTGAEIIEAVSKI